MRSRLVVIFRVVYWLVAALFFIAAGLVIASLYMAESPSHPPKFIYISVTVSGLFLAVGFLILGIQFRTVAIAKLGIGKRDEHKNGFDRHMPVLLAYLTIGGMALCMIMATITFAILARISEGFAVFG